MEEWRQFVTCRAVEIIRGSRSVRLRIEECDVVAAANLARRELACCPFFEFRIDLLSEAIWFEIAAPEEAAAALEALLDDPRR